VTHDFLRYINILTYLLSYLLIQPKINFRKDANVDAKVSVYILEIVR